MRYRRMILAALAAAMLLSGCGEGAEEPAAAEPVRITVWHYYNGEQLQTFDALVEEFNATEGKDKGIVVESSSRGTVNDLALSVMSAANGDAGAEEMPNIFAAYSDTAYALDQLGYVAQLDGYMTEAELSAYVDSYIEEGRLSGADLKIFPVAKSVEIMVLNKTDWTPFAAATGASYEDLATMEGVTAAAEAYYNWTDAQTPEPNDGKALFGRDAMANYFFSGSMQLGTELFQVSEGKASLDFDRDVLRALWDNYYVPFVKGYFNASGRFRSDDLKTGNVLACVCSSSGATYLPDSVSISDSEEHPIELAILPCPQFQGGAAYAIQQGAGMVVTTRSDEEIAASVEFLKWFTEDGRNIRFSVGSGYLPVTDTASDMAAINASGLAVTDVMEKVLTVSVDTVIGNRLYTPPAFTAGAEARSVLEYAMSDAAVRDRAAVVERLAAGEGLEEAAADFTSDEWFETWYAGVLSQLEALVGT